MNEWTSSENEWKSLRDPECDTWDKFVHLNPATKRSAEAWQRKRQRQGNRGLITNSLSVEDDTFLPSTNRDYHQDMMIDPGNGIVIYADVHIPVHDSVFMDKVAEVGEHWGIRKALLAGDFLDMQAWSWFAKSLAEQSTKFDEELEIARSVMMKLESLYDEIWWSLGNHEFRITRSTESRIGMKTLARMIGRTEKLKVTDFSMAIIQDSEGRPDWRVTHPDATRKVPLSWAREQVSMKLQHILVAHTHRPAMALDMSGKFFTIETGMMADPYKLAYTKLKDTAFADPQQGAIILKRGYDGFLKPYQITPESDFEALHRMY